MGRVSTVVSRHVALAMAALISVGALQPGEMLAAAPAPSNEPVRDRPSEPLGPRVVERPIVELGSPADGGAPGAAGVPAAGDPSIGVRTPKGQPAIDPRDLWTEGSRTVVDGNGQYTLEAVAGRMNYQDATGVWQPIDLALVPDAAVAGYGLRTKANDRIVHFGQQDAGDALARLSTEKGTLSVRALDFQSRLVGGPGAPTPTPTPAPTTQPSESPVPEPSSTPVPTEAPAEPGVGSPLPSPEPAAEPTIAPAASPDGSSSPSESVPAVAPQASEPSVTASGSPDPTAVPDPTVQPSPSAVPSPTPTPAPTAVPTAPVDDPSVIRFRKDDTIGDIVVHATDDGFEFGAVLDRADQDNVYAFALDLGDLVAELGTDGKTIVLYQSSRSEGLTERVVVGGISAPVMLDANRVPAPLATVGVRLVDPATAPPDDPDLPPGAIADARPGEIMVVYTIDPAWLAATERVFPVTLDPMACLGEGASGCDINGTGTNFDHFVASGLGSSYPVGWNIVRVGSDSRNDDGDAYNTMRGLFYFEDVALPEAAVVYNSGLTLQISSTAGAPTGETITAYRVRKGWGQTTSWTGWGTSTYDTSPSASDTVPSSGSMSFDVDGIVQSWYTRRGKDWKPDIGFLLKMDNESTGGEVGFHRYNDGTAGNRPTLWISYDVPRVGIDFDTALGPTYAPSTMVAGQATVLPVKVSNNSSGFDFAVGTWAVGYRWFDAKGNVVASAQQALPQCVGSGAGCANPTSTFGLNVTPPSTVGQYTLRLDLVRDGSIDAYASDYARPSLYLSRNKKTLSGDDTRWVGTSKIERDEFSIAVVAGGGGDGDEIETGTGSLGIDLWSKNLSYQGSGGVGFDDVIPVELGYGYESRQVADCGGILDACGWSTTWDERLVSDPTAGTYTYVDPDGARHLVGTDGEGQLTSSADVLLQRQRATFADERVPSNTPTASLVVPPSPGAFSGQYAVKVAAATASVSLGAIDRSNLNAYRFARFAMKASAAASSGLGFKIHNATTGNDTWLVYTVGANWTSTGEQVHLGGTINGATWAYYSRDLYTDVRGNAAFGDWTDDYEVTAVTVYNKAGSTGDIYVDGLRLEAGQSLIIEDANPSWSANAGLTSVVTGDKAAGTGAVRINAASISGSPDCNTTAPAGTPCWSTSAGGLWGYGFIHWQWKKVGGQTAAIVFHLRDERTNATGDLTYFAGPTPPAGAVNPIQVSDAVPTTWSLVRRNLLEDSRQVLNFYNDNAGGSSPSAPPTQGPTGDDVRLIGYRVVAFDGSFLLVDDFDYSTASDLGEDQMTHPSSTGDATFTYDFTATYPDGSVHAFNEVGLLERVVDRDGNAIEFDWSIPTLTVAGAAGYRLDRVHAPSDASTSGFGTYDRDLQLTYAGTSPRTITVTERLGTTGTPITGRTSIFTVDAAGDLLSVKPARAVSCAASGTASGCDLFSYSGSLAHMLTFVGDPRWDQTATTAPSDYRFEVTWAGTSPNHYPTSIVDRSAGTSGGSGSPLLRVLNYAVSGGALPASRRVAWQDAAGISKNFARYSDLTSDGRTLSLSIPLLCGAADCATLPSTSNLADKRASESQFDGLSRVSTSVTYRCPGVSLSGCTGTTPQKIVSRQGTKAGAKVDNFNDPLTSGQIGWTQSPDQYVASLRDSGGSNPDLYRTTYTYDANGQQAGVARPAHNARPAYVDTIKNSLQASGALKGYWRLDETGTSAADASGVLGSGTYTGFAAGNGSTTGALVGTAGAAPTFDGADDYVQLQAPGSPMSGSYSAEAWFRPADVTTTPMTILGSRSGTGFSFDLTVNLNSGKPMLYADVGNGTAWLATAIQGPIATYTANRWYHGALVVDDAVDRATLYLDGQPIATAAFSGTPLLSDASRILRIGHSGITATPQRFKGGIDEVAIYGQALTPSQVASHFMAGRSIAVHTSRTLRDGRWRDVQVDDQFLASPGFESGAIDWEFGGGVAASVYTAATDPGSDVRLHQSSDPSLPASWSSLEIKDGGIATQVVQLVPGQTFRFQVWHRRSGAAGSASIDVSHWRQSAGGAWVSLKNQSYGDTTWAGHAWDITVPFDSDGRVRVTLSETGLAGSDAVYFDDAALLTSYIRTTYTAKPGDPFDGLVRDTITFSPTQAGPIAEFLARNSYAASAATPAIFPTTTTANYVDGIFTASAPDLDVTTTRTFDAWGQELTSTDQDGVGLTTAYAGSGTNGYATDVLSTTNSLGEQTTFEYDLVGNQTKLTAPGSPARVTQTTFDQRNNPRLITDPLGIVSKDVYDAWGFRTDSIANRIDDTPSGASGLDDVTTTSEYDEFGVVTRVTANTGLTSTAKSRTESAHDLTGAGVETKPFAAFDGTSFSAPRTMTQFFEVVTGAVRPKSSASRGPGTFAAASPSPACPDGSTLKCNVVDTLDQDGQAIASSTLADDGAAVVIRTFRDLAGRPAVTIPNYDDGVYAPANPDRDIVSTISYDLFGRAAETKDVLERVTQTTFDAMGREIQVRTIDDSGTAVSDTRTRYTGAGRIDRVSLPGAAGVADTALTWTKTVYDKAGRATKTLEHYDTAGSARLAIDAFEAPISDLTIGNDDVTEAWFTTAGAFVSAGATANVQTPASTTRSGAGRLSVTTGSGANTGAEWALDGTFTSGHLYKARIWFLASSSVSVTARLGVAADAGTAVSATGNDAWQAIDVTWTPTANRTGVRLAVYRTTTGVATFYVDDAMVWDSATGETDWNIPTETAYDSASRIVASIVPPGTVGTAESTMVTRTAYDLLDRPTSVTVNEVAGVGGGGSSTTFTTTADAHVRSASPTSNYGTATTLQVRADAATPNDYKPFLKFSVTGLSGSVTNVKLRLNNTAAASNSSRVACVYAVADTSWTETGITWNTAPTVGASLGCVNGTQAAGWIEYDLGTPFASNGTYAFAVFENVSTSVIYHSKEGTSAPELVVATSGAPSDNVSNLQTATTYDALGRTTSTTDPSGTVTTFGYDRLGRLTSTTENYLDGTASGASGDDDVVSRFGYNAAGELTGYCSGKQVFVGGCDETNPSNVQAWRYAFDDAGRMARQTPPVNTTATALVNRLWEYDTAGRLKKVCDGPASITSCASAGVLRTFESTYDDVGRLIKTDTKSGPSTTLVARTDMTYLGDGQPSQTKYSTGSTPTVVDTIDYAYDDAGRQTKVLRGATTLSERAFNPDGTLDWRKDGDNAALGQSDFGYDWAQRLTSVDLPDTQFSTAVPTFSWRLDGLIGGRTWSGSAATFGYDAAKRVTSLTKGSLSFAQAYDRDGNVTSDGRSLTGVTGDPGTGTQSFSYDALGRVTGSSGLASGSRTYTYDRDGNRLTKVEGGSTYTYTYDRTDQLINVLKTGGSAQSFGYDAYGNMTIDAQSGLTITNMSYDLDDRLTAIDAGGTANDATFTLDALGRFRTRVIAAGTETYSYLDTSETVARIAGPGGTNTDSMVSPAGDRLGVRVGSTVNWFLPDLHGSVAGSLDAAETTLVNAIRYDAWGQTLSTGTAGGTRVGDKAWKYQGRLDVSPDGLATPLYDMSARFYMPGTGTFSQLDTVLGSAQDPMSMNRFLYAQATPASLIDPTGHYAEEGDGGGYKAGPIVRTKSGKIYRKAYRAPSRRQRFDRAHRNTTGYALARRSRSLHADDRREARRLTPTRNTTSRDTRSPIEMIATGLAGTAYDATVGLASNLAHDVTHLDEIPRNLELVGIALTHLDLTAKVAAEDFAAGVDAFGKLPLDEQVRFVGNVAVAGIGPKAGVGATSRVGSLARGSTEAGTISRLPRGIAKPQELSRTHPLDTPASSRLVTEIADDMRANGWNGDPVQVVELQGERYIVDGHHRVAAAKRVGIDVPYEVVDPSTVIRPGKWKSVEDIVRDSYLTGWDNLK